MCHHRRYSTSALQSTIYLLEPHRATLSRYSSHPLPAFLNHLPLFCLSCTYRRSQWSRRGHLPKKPMVHYHPLTPRCPLNTENRARGVLLTPDRQSFLPPQAQSLSPLSPRDFLQGCPQWSHILGVDQVREQVYMTSVGPTTPHMLPTRLILLLSHTPMPANPQTLQPRLREALDACRLCILALV